MTVKPLEEDFRRMGLSPNEIRESLGHIGGEGEEAGYLGESTEEDFEDDVYLSDLVDSEDEEDLGEGMSRVKTHKSSAKDKRASRQYYAKNKSKISRTMGKKRKTAGYKRHQAKLAKAPKGGPRTRRMVSHVEDPSGSMGSMHESLMDELNVLAESIERETTSRFDEYVEAFNHIADLGEMAALKMIDEDDDAAVDLLSLSLKAESVLRDMEEMGGALDLEEDEELEASLADAMEDVGIMFDHYGLLAEEDEEFEEDELEEDEHELEEDLIDSDNPFLSVAAGLREAARGEKVSGRKVLNPGSTKTRKGASKWGKSTTSAKQQLRGRADVRNPEALLGYLKKVKAGKVAPGQPLAMSKTGKPLTKGARAAQKAAGKYRGA